MAPLRAGCQWAQPARSNPGPIVTLTRVKAQARSATNTSVVSAYSAGLSVSIALTEKVSAPTKPTGPTIGNNGVTYTYYTGGAVDKFRSLGAISLQLGRWHHFGLAASGHNQRAQVLDL
jgi:hypothetical protein